MFYQLTLTVQQQDILLHHRYYLVSEILLLNIKYDFTTVARKVRN